MYNDTIATQEDAIMIDGLKFEHLFSTIGPNVRATASTELLESLRDFWTGKRLATVYTIDGKTTIMALSERGTEAYILMPNAADAFEYAARHMHSLTHAVNCYPQTPGLFKDFDGDSMVYQLIECGWAAVLDAAIDDYKQSSKGN